MSRCTLGESLSHICFFIHKTDSTVFLADLENECHTLVRAEHKWHCIQYDGLNIMLLKMQELIVPKIANQNTLVGSERSPTQQCFVCLHLGLWSEGITKTFFSDVKFPVRTF